MQTASVPHVRRANAVNTLQRFWKWLKGPEPPDPWPAKREALIYAKELRASLFECGAWEDLPVQPDENPNLRPFYTLNPAAQIACWDNWRGALRYYAERRSIPQTPARDG